MPMVSPTLTSILRSGRTEFNARFAAARRLYPDLDPGAFSSFMQTGIDDLVCAVAKVRAEQAGAVALAAYDAGLALVGQKLMGPSARSSVLEEGWRRILPRIATLVASGAGRLIPAVCNALHQLVSTPTARPKQWIDLVEQLGPQCVDLDSFLRLGQVCAWRTGLAHFRHGALLAADALPEAMALTIVGAKPHKTWRETRAQLVASPWFDPANPVQDASLVRVASQVGAFRGFGGLFVEPPTVAAIQQDFLVRANGDCWLLKADAFGATFHRASVGDFEAAAKQVQLPPGLRLSGGTVLVHGARCELPPLGEITSAAGNDTTLSLTFSLTHSVVLVALKGNG